ncbi:TPA: hypothetical protein IAB95_06485 [Candidatus Ventrenecus avicola]|nr:hypothetical protein [Candidatus Ventrenecus avicola]
MLILSVLSDIEYFFRPVIEFFGDLWNTIKDFFLQYMSENVFNILIFGIGVAILLIIVLAIMNRDN